MNQRKWRRSKRGGRCKKGERRTWKVEEKGEAEEMEKREEEDERENKEKKGGGSR